MRNAYLIEPNAELRVARAQSDGAFYERDRFFDRTGVKLGLAETEIGVDPVAVQCEHRLVFGDRLGKAALRAQ